MELNLIIYLAVFSKSSCTYLPRCSQNRNFTFSISVNTSHDCALSPQLLTKVWLFKYIILLWKDENLLFFFLLKSLTFLFLCWCFSKIKKFRQVFQRNTILKKKLGKDSKLLDLRHYRKSTVPIYTSVLLPVVTDQQKNPKEWDQNKILL